MFVKVRGYLGLGGPRAEEFGMYARDTEVSVDRSQAEIGKVLTRYGATQRMTAVDDETGRALVGFRIKEVTVRLETPLPRLDAFRTTKRNGKEVERTPEQQRRAYEQESRARWRVVGLLLKAKLEAVELGYSTVEREFMADVVLPGGKTVAETMGADLRTALAGGTVPNLLGPAKGGRRG